MPTLFLLWHLKLNRSEKFETFTIIATSTGAIKEEKLQICEKTQSCDNIDTVCL